MSEIKAFHVDGSQATDKDLILLQVGLLKAWRPVKERWFEDENEAVDVWVEMFANLVRDLCNGYPVDLETLETRLVALQDEALDCLDRDKIDLGRAVHHDPGWVAVGKLFRARVIGLVEGEEEQNIIAAKLGIVFPFKQRTIDNSGEKLIEIPEVVRDPELLARVETMPESVRCSTDVPFHGVAAI